MPIIMKDGAQVRDALINARTTPAERAQLRLLAANQNLSLSDLIRKALQREGFKPER
jgi:hypothetical protein